MPGAVSGSAHLPALRETKAQALERFGTGLRPGRPFRPLLCEYVNGAKFACDLALPITNAVILTKKSLLLAFPFDGHYARGNGYREETDFQMNLFVNGFDIYVTNECHSFHLPMSQVRTGGQRTRPLQRLYWSDLLHALFFRASIMRAMPRRLGLRSPRWLALAAFARIRRLPGNAAPWRCTASRCGRWHGTARPSHSCPRHSRTRHGQTGTRPPPDLRDSSAPPAEFPRLGAPSSADSRRPSAPSPLRTIPAGAPSSSPTRGRTCPSCRDGSCGSRWISPESVVRAGRSRPRGVPRCVPPRQGPPRARRDPGGGHRRLHHGGG